MNIVALAWDIIEMQEKIIAQEEEIFRLREIEKRYSDLLDSSLTHSQQMAGNTLKMLLTPGVSEAFIKANQEE